MHLQTNNFRFVIVGAGRGGTSLLAGLLDFHSSLEVGFELFSAACLMGRKIAHQSPAIFGERVDAFMTACTAEAARYPGKLWGNKITTEQIHGLEDHNTANPDARIDVLDSLFNARMGNQAVIFILRDGRACVNSKAQRTGQSLETACKRWQYSVECYRFFRTRHRDNVCVRFEDLLTDPRATLTSVCDFLKIPYEEQMLNGVANRKMRPEYQSSKIDESKMEIADLPGPYLRMIEDDLAYCGYLK